MKSLRKAEIAIIGGSGLEALIRGAEQIRVGTPFGLAPPISIFEIGKKEVAFLPRHGTEHSLPPHRINYRANIKALHQLGVKRIISTNAVGAINPNMSPGDIVVPHDFVDFCRLRPVTFYDEAAVHVDMSQPYCPEIRSVLIVKAEACGAKFWDKAVLVCTEGPRFETPAEINMFRQLGCDVVGMTGSLEAVLARELEMCYATLCYVSNKAAGMQEQLTVKEVRETAQRIAPIIQQILIETVRHLPMARNCPCAYALENAEFRG
ncbi:MAG: S-methyl-5'-thioadenosine phosphorylase [Candidatus Bathyarchaeia archaeon]